MILFFISKDKSNRKRDLKMNRIFLKYSDNDLIHLFLKNDIISLIREIREDIFLMKKEEYDEENEDREENEDDLFHLLFKKEDIDNLLKSKIEKLDKIDKKIYDRFRDFFKDLIFDLIEDEI